MSSKDYKVAEAHHYHVLITVSMLGFKENNLERNKKTGYFSGLIRPILLS